jgi:hypothetical protein
LRRTQHRATTIRVPDWHTAAPAPPSRAHRDGGANSRAPSPAGAQASCIRAALALSCAPPAAALRPV